MTKYKEKIKEGEYSKGFAYDDTVLVGIAHLPPADDDFRVGIGICDAIAYNRAKDMYFSGLTASENTGRPPIFPILSKGQIVPDDGQLRQVRERDPSIALWTEAEVLSFPHAKGFYVNENIADLVEAEATDKGIVPTLIYHGSNYLAPGLTDSSVLIGFGEGPALVQMISSWYDLVSPAVDCELANMVRGRLDPVIAQELVWHLLSMSVDPAKDTKRRVECSFRLLLTMDDTPEIALEKWNVLTQYKTDMSEDGLQQGLDDIKEKLLRQNK